MKTALVTGITGQDGSYLAELLLKKGYEVHGLVRRVANESQERRLHRINHIKHLLHLHEGDTNNANSLFYLLDDIQPKEVYHIAAQSFVGSKDRNGTLMSNIQGTQNVLEALAIVKKRKGGDPRFYFAGSSEMFGKVVEMPQNERTPFYPRSHYGISKVAGFDLTRLYREMRDVELFACSGILFNHESPRRGMEFVTRKITHTAVKIKLGYAEELRLGNLGAKRDWGFSGDYVEAMWLMLQREKPQDYVIATGETHTVKEFVELSFNKLGMDLAWEGSAVDEVGRDIKTGRAVVRIDPEFFRPAEVELLIGNSSKARQELGWQPRVKFKELVEMMVDSDLQLLSR